MKGYPITYFLVDLKENKNLFYNITKNCSWVKIEIWQRGKIKPKNRKGFNY